MNYLRYTSDLPTEKYHGLSNQGATCYLNSVLQVLFMTEEFREAVERYTSENPDTECIDGHLTSLFGDLKEHSAYTYNITKKLGIDRVYEQRDAAEYFEKILNLTSPEASEIFHGQLTHKTICSACGESTDTNGAFWHLPLALVDSFSVYSVVNGIDEYFRDSYFRGENQMYCDRCDDKCDGTIKCEIKHHPDVLMLLLKRFEFNYDYMTYIKNNCPVAVPLSLQIPQNQTYELYAVVDHFGDLRSGHYTAIIESQDDEKWYNFNDGSVTLLSYQQFQVDNIERSNSAYLLFYRKKNGQAADTCTQDFREVSTPGGFPPAISGMQDQCQDTVKFKEREDVRCVAVVDNDTAVAVSININEETGTKYVTKDGDRFIEEGLPPDLSYNAQHQSDRVCARESRPNSHQEHDEAKNDLHPQDTLSPKITDMAKSIRDEGGDEEKREKSYLSLTSASRMRTVTAKGSVIKNTSYNDQRHKQEIINMRARRYCPQQVKQRDREKVVMDRNTAMDGNTEVYELSQRRRKTSEHQDNEGLADLGGNVEEDEQAEMKTVVCVKNEDNDSKHTHVDENMEEYEQPQRRGNTSEHQDNEGLADVRQNMYEDLGAKHKVEQDCGLKPGSVDTLEGEEGMETDVEVNRERETGDSEREIVSRISKLLTKVDLCYSEVRDRGEVDDNKQNKPKDDQRSERGSSQRSKSCEQQDAGVARQAKGWEKTGYNEQMEDSVASPHSRAGLAASRELIENVEETRQGHHQPKVKTGINDHQAEGRPGSKRSKIYHGKIIEEERRETPGGTQRSSKTRNTRIETVKEPSQGSIKSWVQYDDDPKTDAKVILTSGVCSLQLHESPLPKAHTRRSKSAADAQVQAGMKRVKEKSTHEKKRRWWHRSSPLKKRSKATVLQSSSQCSREKNKRKPSTGYFPFLWESHKNAEHTSESD